MASISSDRDDNDIVPSRRKDLQDLLDLPRAASESFFRKQSRPRAPRAERIAPGAAPAAGMAAQIFRRLAEFVPTRVIKWVYEYLRYRFGVRHPFLVYLKLDLGEGVYKFEDDGKPASLSPATGGPAPMKPTASPSRSYRLRRIIPFISGHNVLLRRRSRARSTTFSLRHQSSKSTTLRPANGRPVRAAASRSTATMKCTPLASPISTHAAGPGADRERPAARAEGQLFLSGE